jgi:hypothetical protein
MAAPSYVFTIRRVAEMLGESEQRIYDIAMGMEPEDGCLAVLDINDESTVAFTAQGIENLSELIEDLTEKWGAWRLTRRPAVLDRVTRRMLTDYLRKVLACIADHPVRRVHELLPRNLDGVRQRLDQRDDA